MTTRTTRPPTTNPPSTDPVLARLRAATDADPAAIGRRNRRLVDAAERAGLLDVAYRVVDSPLGPLLLAATTEGLVRVAFAGEGHDAVLDQLAEQVSPRILAAPARLDEVARQLEEYFARQRREFTVALDLRLAHGFRREVLAVLPTIAYGSTVSYAAVASATGNPNAVRAVGTACGRNPVPVVLPCHRVLRSDGSLGGYLGGLDAKRTLLQLEQAA